MSLLQTVDKLDEIEFACSYFFIWPVNGVC
ncbi:hypothetical protein BCI9360_02225 [Bacillus sp. CECT 9360]|nr:hypothetical protein BCI9360_02225 [Bacillus sp. CECT 9360]